MVPVSVQSRHRPVSGPPSWPGGARGHLVPKLIRVARSSEDPFKIRRHRLPKAPESDFASPAPRRGFAPWIAPPGDPSTEATEVMANRRAAARTFIGEIYCYTRRWESFQVGFVDDPQAAVREAESLVAT